MNRRGPIVKAIIGFPAYAVAFVLGFYIVLVEVEMTAMAIIGILLGILVGPLWGILVFLLLWLLIRTFNQIAVIAQAISQLAQAVRARRD